MSKVQVRKMSQLPINNEDAKIFLEMYRTFYDRLEAKYNPESKLMDAAMGEKLSKKLEQYRLRLIRKYPITLEWPVLKSKRAMKKKCEETGYAIAFGVNPESGELIYLIMDNQA